MTRIMMKKARRMTTLKDLELIIDPILNDIWKFGIRWDKILNRKNAM